MSSTPRKQPIKTISLPCPMIHSWILNPRKATIYHSEPHRQYTSIPRRSTKKVTTDEAIQQQSPTIHHRAKPNGDHQTRAKRTIQRRVNSTRHYHRQITNSNMWRMPMISPNTLPHRSSKLQPMSECPRSAIGSIESLPISLLIRDLTQSHPVALRRSSLCTRRTRRSIRHHHRWSLWSIVRLWVLQHRTMPSLREKRIRRLTFIVVHNRGRMRINILKLIISKVISSSCSFFLLFFYQS